MSRFSTLTSQHSNARDVERQRLERMMGQLRREVTPRDGGGGGSCREAPMGARQSERRFLPPRRRDGGRAGGGAGGTPAASPSPSPGPVASEAVGGGDRSHASSRTGSAQGRPRASAGGCADGTSACVADLVPRPGDEAIEIGGGERAPSVEIAWLWRQSSRMEEEAAEVAAFLTRHNLDRYSSLLLSEGSGLGGSLDMLRDADDEAFEQVGLPKSPRVRLRAALQAELDAELDAAAATAAAAVAASAPSSRPTSSSSVLSSKRAPPRPTNGSVESEGGTGAESSQWGRLGRIPAGWHLADPERLRLRSSGGVAPMPKKSPVVLVDSGCGDGVAEEESDDEMQPVLVGSAAAGAAAAAATAASSLVRRPASSSDSQPRQRPSPRAFASTDVSTDPSGASASSPSTSSRPAAAAVFSSSPGVASRLAEAAIDATDGAFSRPGTAASVSASRPGSSAGDKVCCYECFKQLRRQAAVTAEDASVGTTRSFCGEACAARFRESAQARGARGRELLELRNSLLSEPSISSDSIVGARESSAGGRGREDGGARDGGEAAAPITAQPPPLSRSATGVVRRNGAARRVGTNA
eukprot:TRINITY_DN23095_c0_g1_i1.p1 TRINITY_DN23095_c0_g1~~TRINITY_DN23095_c0_g1_i1.p1  ORF type:complete len:584 (+),score=107.27 TRINITY_DN23095_c0_g1_i1:138-1889(+)